MLKLVIIGGGSSYTPELIEGVIRHHSSLPVTDIVLADVEAGKEKLDIIEAFAGRMLKHAGLDIALSATLDRREALKDADFVITQIRVGGLSARARDERIPLKHGMIGQETTGIGGCMKALRTIPVILDICRDMEELCPNAFLINFTNPSGIVTEAVLKHTKIRCIGLCNCSINMQHDAAERLKVPAEDLDCRFIGLNHLSVMNHAYYRGEDRIGDILKVFNSDGVVKNIEKDREMDRLALMFGCMLSPYLQYFYMEKHMLSEELAQAVGLSGTRAEQVLKVEKKLFEKYADPGLNEKPAELSQRGGARYSEAAINLIDSIYNDRNDVQVVDVRNTVMIRSENRPERHKLKFMLKRTIGSANRRSKRNIPFLPEDAVIETNCRIGRSGAKPLATGPMPDFLSGLVLQVKNYERLTIRAAMTGDRETAFQAFLLNPLVHDAKEAAAALNEMLEENRNELPLFFNSMN